MLHFGIEPPFLVDRFLKICDGLIPSCDLKLLEESRNINTCFYKGASAVLKKWCDFNIALKNELAKIRASRRHIDAARYLHESTYMGGELARVAMIAYRNPSLAEGEKILDQARWNFLEELCAGHYFDLEYLIIYMQKLLILERWENINSADKAELLKGVLVQ